MSEPRSVSRIVPGVVTLEGGGFQVRRPFPTPALAAIDPFLLLDEMGPTNYAPGKAVGAPDHPHRGFETVTYLLAGTMRHRDSSGHTGALTPGDVQWMTAGDGVVHSEMPDPEFQRTGGRMHGFQLWVNLPKKDKRMRPRYQEVPAARIPQGVSADGKVRARVLAGEALGQKAVIETRTPILYLHFTLEKGGRIAQSVPEGFNVFAYVVSGEGRFGKDGTRGGAGDCVIFGTGAGDVAIEAAERTDVLVIGGQPLNESIARYGPFVMNTKAEIVEAFEDFEAGKMGSIEPEVG
ncbi:MAG TPA: pirin family protein [Thermoanaerobaculia bacterium]|nr:pirin family protein [Thermoanaerobaculia bacterium]